jgi:uncharacterized protein (DUF305 family)
MARAALVRAEHHQIKALAQAIIAAQTREIAQMRAWRAAWYGSAATPDMAHMPMPPGMMMSMSDMMHMRHMMGDIVTLKTARPFDKAFIEAMLPHHRVAIMMATLALIYGTHPALKAMAVAIIEDQAREIGLMQAYRDIWYGGTMGHTH